MEDLEPQYDLSEVGFPISEPVPYFAVIVREPNKIRLVNVGPEVVRCVQEKLQQLVKVDASGYVIFKVRRRFLAAAKPATPVEPKSSFFLRSDSSKKGQNSPKK